MSEVEMVAAALVAGASAGLTDSARSTVHDLYLTLRAAVRRRLDRSGADVDVLEASDPDPEVWRRRLAGALAGSGIERDRAAVAMAGLLLDQMRRAGGIAVDASGAKGVQVGDHNTQHNTF
ncbi:hypothetical protein ACIO13_21545 [Streptomyces sp. NPDC087425]|uniref:hypothetical protein n=1 Tax=Streptomyces sp. NPDC087425 TaxID=3365787 RepID=UPI003813A46C